MRQQDIAEMEMETSFFPHWQLTNSLITSHRQQITGQIYGHDSTHITTVVTKGDSNRIISQKTWNT